MYYLLLIISFLHILTLDLFHIFITTLIDEDIICSEYTCVGMTHASIPSLVKKGIKGISVGVNNLTPPPAVPRFFIWQYADESVMATWHPGKVRSL